MSYGREEMSRRSSANLLILILLTAGLAFAQSAAHRKGIPEIATSSNGAVVSIVMSDKDGNPIAQGSGFFVSKDGLVVTNDHVISEGTAAIVKLPDGDVYAVDELAAYDAARDLALIRVQGKNFKVLTLGDSDRVQVGDEVVAIGNPLSLESTVSNGIISGVRREKQDQKLLQVTAPISPGSSGGPLFNMAGDVIGITSSYLKGGENLNFAIPINDLRPLLLDSQGPAAAAVLSGNYICDADVIHMPLSLSVSGPVLALTIHPDAGTTGEMRFSKYGHVWKAKSHGLEEPTPTFSVTNTMRFLLANTFVYDESRGEITAGAQTTGHAQYLTLFGTCKAIAAR